MPPPVCWAYMSDHHSVAIPTESFFQKSSQLAVPVVHIPKRYSYDNTDIIVHIPKLCFKVMMIMIVHIPNCGGEGGCSNNDIMI